MLPFFTLKEVVKSSALPVQPQKKALRKQNKKCLKIVFYALSYCRDIWQSVQETGRFGLYLRGSWII